MTSLLEHIASVSVSYGRVKHQTQAITGKAEKV